jgi:hypothetical protein
MKLPPCSISINVIRQRLSTLAVSVHEMNISIQSTSLGDHCLCRALPTPEQAITTISGQPQHRLDSICDPVSFRNQSASLSARQGADRQTRAAGEITVIAIFYHTAIRSCAFMMITCACLARHDLGLQIMMRSNDWFERVEASAALGQRHPATTHRTGISLRKCERNEREKGVGVFCWESPISKRLPAPFSFLATSPIQGDAELR